MTDAVSGLLNRRGFDRELKRLAHEAGGGPCGVARLKLSGSSS